MAWSIASTSQRSYRPGGPSIRLPYVAARDAPPDPAAPGPSAQDMEDWYAANGWTVYEFDEGDDAMADVDPCPLEKAEASLRGGSGFLHPDELMVYRARREAAVNAPRASDDAAGNALPFVNIGDDAPPGPPPEDSGRTGPGRYTYGIEFEFLLATTLTWDDDEDPHPNDGRWYSRNMRGKADTYLNYEVTVYNRIADAMRRGGVVVNKDQTALCEEQMSDIPPLPTERPGFLFSYEDEHNNAVAAAAAVNHAALVPSWTPPFCVWSSAFDANANVEVWVLTLVDQFMYAHLTRRVQLRDTSLATVDEIARRWLVTGGGLGRLQGGWSAAAQNKLRHHWRNSAMTRIHEALRSYECGSRDPLHVGIDGMADKYRAWLVTEDVSVDHYDIQPDDYQITQVALTDIALATARLPPHHYSWKGTEVISPVYAIDDDDCYATVETALGQLRDELRIHKPFSHIGSGLHIHLGHEDGWNLFQLKRVTTLYFLMEEYLYSVHRVDRATHQYCRMMKRESKLAAALFYRPEQRQGFLGFLPNGGPAMDARYDEYMRPKLPLDIMDENTRKFITSVWRYPSITHLTEAMETANNHGAEGLRYTTFGDKRTDAPAPCQNQTLEFRHMQGTLDAEHVHNWLHIIYSLVRFGRDASDVEFRQAVTELVQRKPAFSVIRIPGPVQRYFKSRAAKMPNQGIGVHFVYPDNDAVPWEQPFMVRGHGPTH